MPDDSVTTPASALIRASIAALPDEVQQPWQSRHQFVESAIATVAQTHGLRGTSARDRIAAYIALMDPTVGAALAALLDTIGRADYDNPYSSIEHIEDARDAVEAAITNSRQT